MPTPDSPDQPAPLEVSPRTWATIGRVAFAGRLTLLAGGLLSLLSVFIETDGVGSLAKTFLVLLTLALVALAALGTTRPRRLFDLLTVVVALTLAGTWGFYAFASAGNDFGGTFHVLQFFAWLATLGGGLAVGSVLVPGPSAAVPVDVVAALGRSRSTSPAPGATADVPAPERPPAPAADGPASRSGTTSTFARPDAPAPRPDAPALERAPARADAPAPARADAPVPARADAPAPAAPAPAPDRAAAPAPDGGSAPSPAAAADRPAAPDSGTAPALASDPDRPTSPTEVHRVAAPRERRIPAAPAADAPEAGWYPAPDGRRARWWDGRAWTGEHRPLSDFDDDASA